VNPIDTRATGCWTLELRSIIVPIHKKSDKPDCLNYQLHIKLYWISILLSRLSPYIDEIIWVHQCGFWHNRSAADQIFCIPQILEKKWKYNETVHELFIDFKKAHYLSKREVLYSILIEFGVPMKLVRLIKMCLNGTYCKDCIGKHLSDSFPIQNGLKHLGIKPWWAVG
jgi:hypothetical protein